MPREYDSTIARIAGNLLSGMMPGATDDSKHFVGDMIASDVYHARWAVAMAFCIVEEVKNFAARQADAVKQEEESWLANAGRWKCSCSHTNNLGAPTCFNCGKRQGSKS